MNDWPFIALSELCDFQNGYAFNSSDYSTEGKIIIRMSNIDRNGRLNITSGNIRFISNENTNGLEQFILKKNDVIIAMTDMSKDMGIIGRTAIIDQDEKYLLNQRVGKFKINSKDLYCKYLHAYTNTPTFINYIKKSCAGGLQLNVSTSAIMHHKIPFPPLSIQKQIAEILEKADKAKQKRKEANKLTDEFLQSVFIEMFGDPVKNPKGWGRKTLPQIINSENYSLKRGPFGSTLRKNIFITSGYLVYEQYHALNNDFTFQRYFISEEKYKELEMFKVSEGDLIVSCSGVYLGKIAIVPKGAPKGIINQALLKITLDRKILSVEYFKFLWNTHLIQKILSLVSRGSGIPNFPSMSEVKSIEFPIPPLSLQQQFAEVVNETEALKEKQKQSELELENLFQSLMQRAFKG